MTKKSQLYIHELAKSSKAPTSSGRSHILGEFFSFDHLEFATAQVAKRAVEYFGAEDQIESKVVIGKKNGKSLTIKGPAVVAAMSFGAVSKNAKLAIAKGATLAGTTDNTGEGGMLAAERKMARTLIAQYSTGRFGVDEDYLRAADIIEIKFGQGAKPGQGGLLPGHKVTSLIAQTRSSSIMKVAPGKSVHSPPVHRDILTIEDLAKRIEWLRELTEGVPIILKIGACNIAKDLPLVVQANPDIIAIDGAEGGTGGSPKVMLDHTGLPTIPALAEARAILDHLKAPQELWIGGGISSGADMAKALALGADIVFVGTALLQALGCVQCGKCHLGKCPLGICTQDEKLVEKMDINEGAEKVANFFNSTREEVKMIAAACGHNNIYDLNREDLIPLTSEMALATGLTFPGMPNFHANFGATCSPGSRECKK